MTPQQGLSYSFILDEGDDSTFYIIAPYEPDATKWLEKCDLTIRGLVNHVIAYNKE